MSRYLLDPKLDPTFDPPTGTISFADIAVTISRGYSGPTPTIIYYSTDNVNWNTYSSAIPISTNTILYAKVISATNYTSNVVSANYTFQCAAPQYYPSGNPNNEIYGVSETVTITDGTVGSTIMYSTDNGSTYTQYTNPISISDTTSFWAYAERLGYSNSNTIPYTVTFQTEAPTFDLTPGTYDNDVSVTISCGQSGATIYYSTDNVNWNTYSSAIPISTNTILYAKAITPNRSMSNIVSANYAFQCRTPQCYPLGGTYNQSLQTVTLTDGTVGSTIMYSTDNGSTYTQYTNPVLIGDSVTIYYYATRSGYGNSSIDSQTFTYQCEPRIYLVYSQPGIMGYGKWAYNVVSESGYIGGGLTRYFNASIGLSFEEALQPQPYIESTFVLSISGVIKNTLYKTTADHSTDPQILISNTSIDLVVSETMPGWIENTDTTNIYILTPPTFSLPGGVYNQTFFLKLSESEITGVIVYSLDPNNPFPSVRLIQAGDWNSTDAGNVWFLSQITGSPADSSKYSSFTNFDGVIYQTIGYMDGTTLIRRYTSPEFDVNYYLDPGTNFYVPNSYITIDKFLTINAVSIHFDRGLDNDYATSSLIVSTLSTSTYTMDFNQPQVTIVNDDASPNITRIGSWMKIVSDEPFEKVWFDVEADGIFNDDYVFYYSSNTTTSTIAYVPILSSKMRLYISKTGWTNSPILDVSSYYTISPVYIVVGNNLILSSPTSNISIDFASEIINTIDQPIPTYTVPNINGYSLYRYNNRQNKTSTQAIYINNNGLGRSYVTIDGSNPNPQTPSLSSSGTTQYFADYNAADPSKTDVLNFLNFKIITVFNMIWSLTNSSVVNYDGTGPNSPLSRSKFGSYVFQFTIYVKVGTPTYSFPASYEMSEINNVVTSDGSLTVQRMIEILQSSNGMDSFSANTTQTWDKLRILSKPVLIPDYPTLDDISNFVSLSYPTLEGVLNPNSIIEGFSISIDSISYTNETTVDSLLTNSFSQVITGHTLLIFRGESDDCIPSDYVVLLFASKLPSPLFNYTNGYYKTLTKEIIISQGNNLISLPPYGIPVFRYNRVDKFGDENMLPSDVSPPNSSSPIWDLVTTPFYPIVSTAIEVEAFVNYNFTSDPSTLLLNIVKLVPPTWDILDSSGTVLYSYNGTPQTVFITDDKYTLRLYPFMDGEYTFIQIMDQFTENNAIYIKIDNINATTINPSNNQYYIDIPLENNYYPPINATTSEYVDPFATISLSMWTRTDIIGVSPTVSQTISFESKPCIINKINQPNDIETDINYVWTYTSISGTYVSINNPFPPLPDAPKEYLGSFEIVYTIDGSDPQNSSTAKTFIPNGMTASPPILINVSTTVNTLIKYPLRLISLSSQSIELIIFDPYFDLPSGSSFEHKQTIAILCKTDGVKIYYTTDGSDPIPSNQFRRLYLNPLQFEDSGAITIKAIAEMSGWTSSNIVSSQYTFINTTYITDASVLKDSSSYVRNIDR